MAFAGFNVNKTWRAKVEGRRKRGRGREETPLKSPEFKSETSNADHRPHLKDYSSMWNAN